MDDYNCSELVKVTDMQEAHNQVLKNYSVAGISKKTEYVPSGTANASNSMTRYKKSDSSRKFFNAALGILYTLTPAILILDKHRCIVFANREAEELLSVGDVISQDSKGKIFCTDHVAQNFLLEYLLSHKTIDESLYNDNDGSFLIPKADGWPMVAMVGCDQLDALPFAENGMSSDGYMTLMIRDPNGRNPEQSKKLMEYFGLSGAESCVVGALVEGASTDEIARQRGVSVITIRNQLKSAQSKMGVGRQSELVSLVLRYVS